MLFGGMMHRIGQFAETAFCFFAISAYTGAYIALTQASDYKMGDSNPFNAVAQAIILFGLVILIAIHWRKVLFVAMNGGVINLFVIFALASALWSDYPMISLKRSGVLLQTVFFAYYLVAQFSIDRLIQIWASALVVSMVASVFVALAFPSFGIMSGADLEGAWRGVFTHKSQLGAATILGSLCIGWLWVHEPRRRLYHTFCLLLCVGLAVMSKSKTAQISLILIFGAAICLPFLRLPGLARVWVIYSLAAGVSVAGILLFDFFGDVMTALGKDASFTGRVPTWTTLLRLASDHLGLGYGYEAFFVEGNLDSDYVSGKSEWLVIGAHNGYVELLLDLGVPGLLLGVFTLLRSLYGSLRVWSDGTETWASFAAVYLISFSVTNFVESDIYRGGDVQCVIFPAMVVALRIGSAVRSGRTASNAVPTGFPSKALSDYMPSAADSALLRSLDIERLSERR